MNEQAEIILFEKDEYVSFANCGLPYYIGDEISERGKLLVATPEFLASRYRLDVRIRQEIVSIDRDSKSVKVHDHQTQATYDQPYDKLILAPGARPVVPPLEGLEAPNVYTLRNVDDTDRIKEATVRSSHKRAVVVGAGFIGLEMVEQLAGLGFDVTLVELQRQVLPLLDAEMAEPLAQELERNGISVQVGAGLKRVVTDEAGVATAVELDNGRTMSADLVILGIGVRPNHELAKAAGLELGDDGGICTNDFMQTSDPDIYAVGDAAHYPYGPTGKRMRVALAGPANRAGRLAGQHAATGSSDPLSPVLGTSIVRVFGQTAGITGLSVAAARRWNIPVRSVTIVANNHAGYYPGASPVTLKLVYDPENGRVLGAQAVGTEGVDKRLDVIATSMAFQATVRDLAGLDLCYAPPFGSAKDPVHMAAFAACNELDGFSEFVAADANFDNASVLDVRSPAEVEKMPLAGAKQVINIPLDELRDRIGELDPTVSDLVVTCRTGMRGHVAARLIRQLGFQHAKTLTGGVLIRNRAMETE
jgi:NADPH-dependent 2,4-dienoyl-CoA reductase/sulfur reductase-like enzyme/rhodanese-related sulfurtransferase